MAYHISCWSPASGCNVREGRVTSGGEWQKTAGKTATFISYRFSTVRLADRIFVIESGSHAELMKKDGRYAELFNLQAEAY